MSADSDTEVVNALPARPVPDAAMRARMDALGLSAADAAIKNALAKACWEGDLPRAWRLLELGARAMCEKRYISPLQRAVSVENHVALVELLVAYGADAAGLRDSFGHTLLHSAASAAMARALLAAGCDIGAVDTFGNTPLHRARFAGTTCALLAAGADPAARNNKGQLPLHCQPELAPVFLAHAAERGGREAVVALLAARDGDGHTPLLRAAAGAGAWWLLVYARRLCALSDWSAVDARGRTALHLLARANYSGPDYYTDEEVDEEEEEEEEDERLKRFRELIVCLRALLAGDERAFADAPGEPTVADIRARYDAEIAALEPAADDAAHARALRVDGLRRRCEKDVADAEATAWARGVLAGVELPQPNVDAGLTLSDLLSMRDNAGETPLHTAVRKGNEFMLRVVFENCE